MLSVPGPDGRSRARLVEIARRGVAGGPASAPGTTTGTLESSAAESLRLRTANGAFMYVLTAETESQRTVSAHAADLATGLWVRVTGDEGTDGTIQARTVTLIPAPSKQGITFGSGGQRPPGGAAVTATAPAGR